MPGTVAIESNINLAALIPQGVYATQFSTSVILLHVCVAKNLGLTALVTNRGTLVLGVGCVIFEENVFLSFKG